MTTALPSQLRFGPIGPNAAHICVDMQRIFREDTPWKAPWMERILPRVHAIADHRPSRTIFTRFLTAQKPGSGPDAWARYWTKWSELTRERLDPRLLELVPELAPLAAPGRVVNKRVYSPWLSPDLPNALSELSCNTAIVTGGETDVCVLATVLGAVDRGYRVIVVSDAVCSSTDETHDAIMTLYQSRFSEQIEVITTAGLLEAWR